MYRDETYLSYFGDRSPFVRAARKSDLVMPDEARAVAKELGIPYYETSVFTYFGVNEVFENAIRAALIARRQQRFWMTNVSKQKCVKYLRNTQSLRSLPNPVEASSASSSTTSVPTAEANASRGGRVDWNTFYRYAQHVSGSMLHRSRPYHGKRSFRCS